MKSGTTSSTRGLPHNAGKAAKRAVTSLEEALLTREEWLRLAAQGSELGLWYWDERTQGLFCDRRTREIFGVNLEGEVSLDTFYAALHPDDLTRVKQVWRSQLESGVPYELEYRARRPDGSVRWVNAKGSGYYNKAGKPLYMIGVVFDVTERKSVEQERLELGGRLINIQERESRRLAQEIHDDFCQRIAVLTIKLQTLAAMLKSADAHALVGELIGECGGLGSDLHALSHRLHSSKLEILGLVPSVDALCRELAKEYGVKISLTHTDVPNQVPTDVALAVFRIAQEALRNVIKHSGASTVEVRLQADAGVIGLTVLDNGKGLDITRNRAFQGIGVQSMKERARMLGGSFEIHSQPATEGTRVAVTIPLKRGPCAP